MAALEGLLKRASEVEVFDIPLGDAVVGGSLAILTSEVTDAFLLPRIPTVPAALVKAGEALAMVKWGPKLVGNHAAKVAALFLTYEAVRTVVPLDTWISGALKKVGVAAHSPMPTANEAEMFLKGTAATADYNVAMFGR